MYYFARHDNCADRHGVHLSDWPFAFSGVSQYEHIAERRDATQHPAPGRLIQVGDHRLHLFCQGSNGPTVVIEQGAGSPSPLWWPVQEKIASFAHVCTYDRAGYLWSEPVRRPRSVRERLRSCTRCSHTPVFPDLICWWHTRTAD